jgi:hypothetical protein
VALKPYVEHIQKCYDPTQSAAIEVCASLAASDAQVSEHLAAASTAAAAAGGSSGGDSGSASARGKGAAVLPVVLIQGPPGTGKTKTVKVRIRLTV